KVFYVCFIVFCLLSTPKPRMPSLTNANKNIGSSVGIANLPNQLHKIVCKKGGKFTLMIVGESGLGKTTFINTLFTTGVLQYKNMNDPDYAKKLLAQEKTTEIELTKAVIEEKGFHVQLTIIDTPGFGDYVDNTDAWLPIVEFIDDQHEAFLRQENQPDRKNVKDLRVHACLYFIEPTGHSLRELDIEAMKHLSQRVNLIPVIAKADTLSATKLSAFKDRIRSLIFDNSISVYTCPLESDDEETTKRNVEVMSAMPFAVIGSTDEVERADGKKVLGRKYPWGVAEVENEKHSDFKHLRSLLVRTHMQDLIQTTEEIHYENYRLNRLQNRDDLVDPSAMEKSRELFEKNIKQEEEKFKAKLAEKVQVEENRFRAWDHKLAQERTRLMKNLESEHSIVKQLITEVELLEAKENGHQMVSPNQ
ncbi:hypothetical protein MP638_002900, partial [Amoeboaphelidium occidentale]